MQRFSIIFITCRPKPCSRRETLGRKGSRTRDGCAIQPELPLHPEKRTNLGTPWIPRRRYMRRCHDFSRPQWLLQPPITWRKGVDLSGWATVIHVTPGNVPHAARQIIHTHLDWYDGNTRWWGDERGLFDGSTSSLEKLPNEVRSLVHQYIPCLPR
jgi:hypothetical protein